MLSFGLVPATPVGAVSPDWLAGWANRVKLTIDSGDIDDNLTGFPILLYISESSGRYGDDISFVFDKLTTDDNRKKIAVTAADGTAECYVEIEKWDDASEEAWLWVKVPDIAKVTDTDLYLYFDCSHTNNTTYVGDTNDTPAESVWDSSFRAVFHMADGADDQHIYDSTSNNNDGTKGASGEPTEISGPIANAQDFDGDDEIDVTDNASIDVGTSDFTIEAWVEASDPYEDPEDDRMVLVRKVWTLGDDDAGYEMQVGKWGRLHGFVRDSDATPDTASASDTGTLINNDVMRYCSTVYDRDADMTRYVNGASDGSADDMSTTDSSLDNSRVLTFGYRAPDSDRYLDGILDEVRISVTARSAAWIKASYESERDNLLDFGDEESVTLALMPGAAVNPIGTEHCVNGTVSPVVEGVEVLFEVTSGPNSSESGSATTDEYGNAVFCYNGIGGTGTDNILACIDMDCNGTCGDAVDIEDTATKTWFRITSLWPLIDINPIKTWHTVTASIWPRISDVEVCFEITGPNSHQSGCELTNRRGRAYFTYFGDFPGIDSIRAYIDENGNDQWDSGEHTFCLQATKIWLVEYVTGGGNINNGKRAEKITFGGNVGYDDEYNLHGQWNINFHDVNGTDTSFDKSHFHSTEIEFLDFKWLLLCPQPEPPDAFFNWAHFRANGTVSGQEGEWSVDVEISDHGEGKKARDTIRIKLYEGTGCVGIPVYDTSEHGFPSGDFSDDFFCLTSEWRRHLLDGGNIQIHHGIKE